MIAPQRLYYLIAIVAGLMGTLMGVVSTIYRVTVVDLNPLQLVLVGTTLEIAYFLGEIPTGIVADVYSRKWSVIIGYLLVGAGFIVEGAIAQFWAVLLAQVIWGVGATFLSGALTAWLADEAGEGQLTATLLRAGQIGSVVGIAGTLLAMVVGSINLGLGFIIAGVGHIGLALLLVFLMPETGFAPTPRPQRNSWQKMGDTFREGRRFVRASPMLQLIFALEICFGLASEGIDRLREAHLLQSFRVPAWANLEPVVWLGALGIVTMLFTIVVTELIRRKVGSEDDLRLLQIFQLLNLGYMLAILLFAFAVNFATGAAAMVALQMMRRASGPLYHGWTAKQVTPAVRATVLSMWGQMNAIGQIVGGPLIGLLATLATLPLGIAGIVLFLMPTPLLIARAVRRTRLLLPQNSAAT